MTKSTALRDALLDHVLGGPSYSRLATVYFALLKTGEVEVVGNGYSRVAVANDGTSWEDASGGTKYPKGWIRWPEATASWGVIYHVAVYDADTGGNQLWIGTILSSRPNIGAGERFYLNSSSLHFSEA